MSLSKIREAFFVTSVVILRRNPKFARLTYSNSTLNFQSRLDSIMKTLHPLTSSLLALILATPAVAQAPTIEKVYRYNDPIPDNAFARDFRSVAVDNQGETMVDVFSILSRYVLRSGTIRYQTGEFLPKPPDARLLGLLSYGMDGLGNDSAIPQTDATNGYSYDVFLYWNDTPLISQGDSATGAGFGPNSEYQSFAHVRMNQSNQMVFRAVVVDGSESYWTIIRLTHDGNGSILNEEALVTAGDFLPGESDPIDFVNFADINNQGDYIAAVNLVAPNGFYIDAIVVNGQVIAKEGEPSVVIPGASWSGLNRPGLQINDSGTYVYQGNLDNGEQVIVRNDELIVSTGQTIPDIAPFQLSRLGYLTTHPFQLGLSEVGDVYWYGEWNNSDLNNNSGIFINHKIIVEEGISQVDNETLGGPIQADSLGFQVSSSGQYLAFIGEFDNGDEAVFRVTMDPLQLADPSPGLAGMQNQLTVANGIPGERVGFAGSLNFNRTTYNCSGIAVILGLDQPIPLGDVLVSPTGIADLFVFVPANLSGATVWLQALELGSCRLTNLVSYTFP